MIEFNYLYHGMERQKFLTVRELVDAVRSGKYAKGVEDLRKEVMLCRGMDIGPDMEMVRRLPYVVFSSGEKGYTGYVMISLPCQDEAQLEEVRKKVNRYLQVVCSFKGASGLTLKVVIAYLLADGREMESLVGSDRVLFHTNAYCQAVDFIQANTGVRGDGRGCNPEDGGRVSVDEAAYVNDNVVPIIIEMPTELPELQMLSDVNVNHLTHEQQMLPGYSEVEMEVIRFNLVRRQWKIDDEGDDVMDVISLAEACCKAGVNEEIAVKCTLAMLRFHGKEMLVRTSFERAYAEGSRYKNGRVLSKNVLNIELMQHFLASRYRFRQNELTGSVEYAEITRYVSTWKPFTERERNTMCLEALKAGIEVWDKDIRRYVNSTLISSFDPISEWMMQLPDWDGKDRVGELLGTVKSDWDMWPEMFRVWLRSMVSQWSGRNRLYGATMVLMLTGKQGTGKSTFFKRLLPQELSAYYVDRLDFTNKKDAERALMRFCLINLDEFDQISPRQTAFLKHMLQKSNITYRKMYQDDIEQRRRYAAFCATTNSDAPLTDPTGSRRYLVVEVTEAIDNTYPIDYEQLYAQVMYEIRQDKPTYFTAEMERMIQEHNGNYTEELPLATMFEDSFLVAKNGEDCQELTSTEILLELKERYGAGIAVNKSTSTQLGKYLAGRGVHSVMKEGRRVYRLTRQ